MFREVVVACTFFANIIIAFIVFKKNTKSATNILLAILSIVIALWTVFNFLALSPGDEEIRLLWVRVVMMVTAPLGPIIFLLATVFPERKLKINGRFLTGLTIFTVITSLLGISPYMFTNLQNLPDGNFALTPGPAILLFAIAFLAFMTWGFVRLIKKYRHSTGLIKKQLGLFLLGICVSFALLTATNFIAVVVFGSISLTSLGPPFTLIMVGTMTYAIIRHRFLDIKLIIIRSLAYSILIGGIALAYSAIFYFLGRAITGVEVTPTNLILTLTFILFIVFTFIPLKQVVEQATKKIFYKNNYDIEKLLQQIGKILSDTLVLDELSAQVLQKIVDDMNITHDAVVLVNDAKILFMKSAGQETQPVNNEHLLFLIDEANKNEDKFLLLDEMSESPTKDMMRQDGMSVVLPLVVENKVLGALVLGEKLSGETYALDDIEVLNIFAPQLAIAIRNSLSYEEIRKFNITLEKEVEKATSELKVANNRLRELDELKDEFVSVASHELRTPMTAIKSYLWLALNKPPKPLEGTTKEYINIAYNSTERLIHLVQDMLTISRIENNRLELHKSTFDMGDVVKQTYDELKITADERKIHFMVENPLGEVYVSGDKDKLREVVQNIVGNALKFTPDGGKITIKLQRDEVKHMLAVSVIDTGPGITKEDLPKLFLKFSRLEHSYQKIKGSGTGLGLYIAKQIVNMHNGDITIASELEKGSTFTFTLPEVAKDYIDPSAVAQPEKTTVSSSFTLNAPP